MGAAYLDPLQALANCRSALHLLAAPASLPGAFRTADGLRENNANPPVAAFYVWKLYQLTGDRALLEEAYPLLLHRHKWWRNARDGNGNRQLNWGSVAETGMPGHPLYTTAPVDAQTGVLCIDDVALYAL